MITSEAQSVSVGDTPSAYWTDFCHSFFGRLSSVARYLRVLSPSHPMQNGFIFWPLGTLYFDRWLGAGTKSGII
jgi:hypothetical protein